MKSYLLRIDPGDLGKFFAAASFAISIPAVVFAVLTVGPGKTVHLKGLLSLIFTGSLKPVGLVLAYPFLNALAGVVLGFLSAFIYNLYSRKFGGIAISNRQKEYKPRGRIKLYRQYLGICRVEDREIQAMHT